jgi:predicted Zn-dependent protease
MAMNSICNAAARNLQQRNACAAPMMTAMLAGVILAAAGSSDTGMRRWQPTRRRSFGDDGFPDKMNREADRIGLTSSERAGYDPEAMPDMFERRREKSAGHQTTRVLLTHPVTQSRIADSPETGPTS